MPPFVGKALSHVTQKYIMLIAIWMGSFLNGSVLFIACAHSLITLTVHYISGTCSFADMGFSATPRCVSLVPMHSNSTSIRAVV
eukprot:13564035-Ditylum_brightwellii.AAC.1